MKKIVFVCQSVNYLIIDIINQFCDQYSNVDLICGKIDYLERGLNSKVKLLGIIHYNRKNIFSRIWTWIISMLQISYYLILRFRGYEIVYVTNPPVSYFVSFFIPNTFSIIVFDVYPDALENIGIEKKNYVHRLWTYINKRIFKKAKIIFTLSKGMISKLSNYINVDKVRLINNWSGFDDFELDTLNTSLFISKNNINNKFIIMYSGNMGFTHSIEPLIEVANILSHEKDILFLFIGEGEKKKMLIDMSIKYKIQNCLFLTWQDTVNFKLALSVASLGVITINEKSANVSVPSKTYNLLSARLPLLCISPKNSEIDDLITKYNNGKSCEANKFEEIAEFILLLKNNKKYYNELSSNSHAASKDFHHTNSKKYFNLISK